MNTMHVAVREAETFLCGAPAVPGPLRRYLFAGMRAHYHEYYACPVCVEREPLAELAETDLGGERVVLCRSGCGRPGTHNASYDGRWTCEQCIY